jgi:hypothetical protein
MFSSCTFRIALKICMISTCLFAQNQTVGLFTNTPEAFNGYTLLAPLRSKTTYLIDIYGRQVHSWESTYSPGNAVYLLENGKILRTVHPVNQKFNAGGSGGGVQLIEWDGTISWEFLYSTNKYCHHHDAEMLPNGNVLIIVWELKTQTEAEAAGRDPSLLDEGELWPDCILEVKPSGADGGDIVWEWHAWDHLIQEFDDTKTNFGVVADHPELLDINYTSNPNTSIADWMHTNAVDYHEALDQIVISVHNMNEIYIIDHSTADYNNPEAGILAAAGHEGGSSGKGGDILYRWGNPQVYGAGSAADEKLFVQHDVQWIESGLPGEDNILIFNNGGDRNYSSVDEIVTPVDESGNYPLTAGSTFSPDEQTWIYTAANPSDFYGQNISGCQRLANGNTLICEGPTGRIFEVTSEGTTVWEYINPVAVNGPVTQGEAIPTGGGPGGGGTTNQAFRAYRYAPDYAGLAGQDLTPGDPIELDFYPVGIENANRDALSFDVQHVSGPDGVTFMFSPGSDAVSMSIYDIRGNLIKVLSTQSGENRLMWNGKNKSESEASCGLYYADISLSGNDRLTNTSVKQLMFMKTW